MHQIFIGFKNGSFVSQFLGGAGDNHAYPSARDKDKKVQDVETPKDVC